MEKIIQNFKIKSFDIILKPLTMRILENSFKFKLIDNDKINLKKKEIKQIFMDSVIRSVCEEMYKSKSRIVLLYNRSLLKNSELIDYVSEKDLDKQLKRIFKILNDSLPIIIFECGNEVTCSNTESGEYKQFIQELNSRIYFVNNKSYSFQKIKAICKRYNLVDLYINFFESNSIKSILH